MLSRFYSALRLPHIALALLFALMLTASWQRWTSAIADSGRELDLPLRLLRGEMLYRDAHYIYPPLSPYLNAFLYRLFGVHLDVLNFSGIVCAILLIVLCYRIARRILPTNDAVLAVAAIIVWCVFRPAGNLIAPYAFAALHGTLFALGSLFFVLRYSENKRMRELIASGTLIGLAAITKQEFAFAAGVTLTFALLFIHRAELKQTIKRLLIAALPAVLIVMPVVAILAAKVGAQTLIEDCHLLYTHLPQSLVYYNSQRTGFDHPVSSLAQLLGGTAIAVAIVCALIVTSLLIARSQTGDAKKSASQLLQKSFIALLVVGALALTIKSITQGRWDGSPLRALPLILLVVIWQEWRNEKRESAQLFIIAAYSFAVLARVALRVPSGGAFGGFFLPTSLIVIVYLLAQRLPQFIVRQTQSAKASANINLLAHSFLLFMLISTAIIFGLRFRKNYSFEINTARGHLYATPSVGQAMREAIDFLQSHTAPHEPVAVVPEGSDITFLAGRTMPLRHQIMIPGLMSDADEIKAIRLLRDKPVRYVLVVNRPMREFGAEAFGRDFYPNLGQWLDQHYRIAKVCGPVKDEQMQIGNAQFFIKILELKESR